MTPRSAGRAGVLGSAVLALLACLVIGAFAAPVAQGATFPKMVIKFSSTHPVTVTAHLGAVKFAELVKERTGGAVEIQIFPNSQLGNEKDLVEQVKNGVVQMSNPSNGMFANFEGYGYLGASGIPYIFKGEDEEEMLPRYVDLMRSPLFKELGERAIKLCGMRALDAGWWVGPRHLTTRKTLVTTPNDLKGLKIRTPDAPIMKLPMTILGAAVTPMAWAEVYTALQLGVIDGQENALNTIYENKMYEVQKYTALTFHMVAGQVPIVNEKFFQSLAPELRAVIEKSIAEAGDYQNALQLKANKKSMQDLKDKGMTVNTVKLAAFAEKAKDGWKDFEPIIGKGVYERVKQSLK